ncbi:hypothetical protein T05_15846, partial [Trichinella murrelli]
LQIMVHVSENRLLWRNFANHGSREQKQTTLAKCCKSWFT